MSKVASSMSETEKAIAKQPRLLGLDWSRRLRAIAPLLNAKRSLPTVAFVGTGTSYHAALWAHWLCRLETDGQVISRASTTWDELAAQPLKRRASARKVHDELLVVISHRGRKGLTADLLDGLPAEQRHVLLAAEGSVTGKSPYVATSPQETSQAHTMSLVAAIGACSEIVASLTPNAAGRISHDRLVTARLIDQLLGSAPAPLVLESAFTRLHFVGGGPLHAIALELALKAREVAHVPAQGYALEEILHGPFTAIENDDALVLLDALKTPADARSKRLYRSRMKSCRESAEAIGCLSIEPRLPPRLRQAAAKLPVSWQALLPLMWGQLFCLTHAKQWGFDPDNNRREDPRYDEAKLAAEYPY